MNEAWRQGTEEILRRLLSIEKEVGELEDRLERVERFQAAINFAGSVLRWLTPIAIAAMAILIGRNL